MGGEDSQNHQNILKTYRNTIKTSGLVSRFEIIPPNFVQIFKTQDAAMATKRNLKNDFFSPLDQNDHFEKKKTYKCINRP